MKWTSVSLLHRTAGSRAPGPLRNHGAPRDPFPGATVRGGLGTTESAGPARAQAGVAGSRASFGDRDSPRGPRRVGGDRASGDTSPSVLQFGFVTIFVAACPLAPLFALLNNWVEIRLDARKLVCERRRPVAERAQDVGIWFPILAGITHLAVISNALLLAFSSDFLPRTYYRWTRARDLRGFVNFTLAHAPPAFAAAHNRTCRYQAFREDDGQYSRTYWNLLAIRLAFVIVFEHVVFSIGRVLDLLVPDIPESVEIKVKREYYLAKQALAENEALFGTNDVKDGRPQASDRGEPGPTV